MFLYSVASKRYNYDFRFYPALINNVRNSENFITAVYKDYLGVCVCSRLVAIATNIE